MKTQTNGDIDHEGSINNPKELEIIKAEIENSGKPATEQVLLTKFVKENFMKNQPQSVNVKKPKQ